MRMSDVSVVIPAAGEGTRFGMYTEFIPKEMLPVWNKPLIYWAVKEAVRSGFKHTIIVINEKKEMIKSYISKVFSNKKYKIVFVYQAKRRGIGDALLQARHLIQRDFFLMLIPDQFLYQALPGRELVRVFRSQLKNAKRVVVSTLIGIRPGEKRYFSGMKPFKLEESISRNVYKIEDFSVNDITMDRNIIRGFGRTLFPTEIFRYFNKDYINPVSGEVDLYLTFQETFKKLHHYGVIVKGGPMDFGDWEKYLYFSKRVNKELIP